MKRNVSSSARSSAGFSRRGRRRGVSDIVATILLVAITVVLAALLYVFVLHYTSSGSSTPVLGSALSLATPQEEVAKSSVVAACSATPCNFYNMSVQSAAKGLELHNLAFEVEGQNGSRFAPTGGVVVLNQTAHIVSTYGFATGWATNSTMHVTDLLTISLYTSGASPQSLSGDTFIVNGLSGFSGSIQVHIF